MNSSTVGSNSGQDVTGEPVPDMCGKERKGVLKRKSSLQYLDHIIRKTFPRNDIGEAHTGVRDSHRKMVEMKKFLLEMLRQSSEMLQLSREMQRQSELMLGPELSEPSGDPL